jgi:hypothetical protein
LLFCLAAWKIIKTWLPAGAVKKIKFLTKTNIEEYVAEDQVPISLSLFSGCEVRLQFFKSLKHDKNVGSKMS